MNYHLLRLLLAVCTFSSFVTVEDLRANNVQSKEFLIISPTNQLSHGFFSCANLVLSHLYLFDIGSYNANGMKVDFGDKGFYFHQPHGQNWWEYYFEPTIIGRPDEGMVRHTTQQENEYAWSIRRSHINKQEAHRIINKYITVRKDILEKVNRFKQMNFKNHYVIGIHYRGTDKADNIAPRVPFTTVSKKVRTHLKNNKNKNYKIFVATDEQAFLHYMEKTFPGKIIALDAIRSSDNTAVHKMKTNPYKIGEEALIDCLLLSNCSFLIRTSSNLSLWSTFFNPSLPELLLSHHKGGVE